MSQTLMFMSHKARSSERVYLEYEGNYACSAFRCRADQRLSFVLYDLFHKANVYKFKTIP